MQCATVQNAKSIALSCKVDCIERAVYCTISSLQSTLHCRAVDFAFCNVAHCTFAFSALSPSVQFRSSAIQNCSSAMQTSIAKHRSVRFFGPVLRFVMLFNTRDGIQAAHSTRNFNANILHQNQHNPSRLSKWFSGCKVLKPNNFQRAFLTIIWRRAMVKYY